MKENSSTTSGNSSCLIINTTTSLRCCWLTGKRPHDEEQPFGGSPNSVSTDTHDLVALDCPWGECSAIKGATFGWFAQLNLDQRSKSRSETWPDCGSGFRGRSPREEQRGGGSPNSVSNHAQNPVAMTAALRCGWGPGGEGGERPRSKEHGFLADRPGLTRMSFMRHRLQRISFAFVIASLAASAQTASAQADSLHDYFGPREISVGESMRAAATGARAITLNPAGLTLNKQLVFEASYGFRPEDGASSVAVSACDSTNKVPGCYYYRYFTAEPKVGSMTMSRRAHEFGMALSVPLTPRLAIGSTTKYFDYNSQMTGETDAAGFATDAGLVLRATNSITLGVAGYNLVAKESAQYPRGVGGGIAIRPSPSIGLTADGAWNLDAESGQSKGRYGGGAEYFYRDPSGNSGYSLRAGGIHDTSKLESESGSWLTGGIGYTNPKIGIDIGARRKMGGDELLVLAGLRVFGPR